MDQDFDNDQDKSSEGSWGRTWEDQFVDEMVTERDDLEEQLRVEQEQTAQNMWLLFQNAAASVTQLYKERLQGNNSWYPFQNAAGAVTILYKDALDAQKRSFELGMQLGCQRRIRDIVVWAKKRRRIRRDELIAFMCNKSIPSKPQRHSPPRTRPSGRSNSDRGSPPAVRYSPDLETEPDLTPFQNALSLHGLSGAMSNVSVEYPGSNTQPRSEDLNCFIMEGLNKHNETRKRMVSHDATMDSPTRKRSRIL